MSHTFSPRFKPDAQASQLIRRYAQPFSGELREFDKLIDLIGDRSFVLIGEATHGTHEFYKTRIDLTRRLISECGFTTVAVEADWPDAWRVNRYVKGLADGRDALASLEAFKRFPTWLWRNADVLAFVEWLKKHNDGVRRYDDKVDFVGLDLYSLYRSADAVVEYLNRIDPDAAVRARAQYSCLSAYGADEQVYGYASALGLTRACEAQVVAQLIELQKKEMQYLNLDGKVASDEFFFAEQNARLILNAQTYYREMFRGRLNTWNVRDMHMLETLVAMQKHMAENNDRMKVVVWAHNSHLGDARATQMSQRGELNLGQLVRQKFPDETYSIGFTTNTGLVTAASTWGGHAEKKFVRPALLGSYEHLFSQVDLASFVLTMDAPDLVSELGHERLERAIGVLYLPQTERASHYFSARLSAQFDAVIHFQDTQAVEPLERTAEWISGEDRAEDKID